MYREINIGFHILDMTPVYHIYIQARIQGGEPPPPYFLGKKQGGQNTEISKIQAQTYPKTH